MYKRFLFILLAAFCFSCEDENEMAEEIAKIPVTLNMERFDQRFAAATADSLPELKKEFPYLFPKQFHDSVWVNKINDTLQREINAAVEKKYPDLQETREELKALFQHVKYYFPDTEIPNVVTLTSNVDYRNSVIWENDLLLIALDTYLGEEHHFYLGIQEFLKKNFREEQIAVDAARAFSENLLSRPNSRIFLDHMVYFGKLLYLKDKLIPFKSDAEKIGYTSEELQWAQNNEEQIWRYFIEEELLYDTDSELYSRFLYPAPFSKFYLQLDHEAPAKLGQYIGWQIVRQYMDENDIPLGEMLQKDAEEIFNQSNYKPRK